MKSTGVLDSFVIKHKMVWILSTLDHRSVVNQLDIKGEYLPTILAAMAFSYSQFYVAVLYSPE